MKTGEYGHRTDKGRQDWRQDLIRELGIVDEGNIADLVDLEERMELDERILKLVERGKDYGRGI